MPNIHIRVSGYHADTNGNKVKHSGGGSGNESYLISVPTVGADARPDQNGINTALSNNAKLRGAQFIVTSYVTLDKEHDNAVNILT